MDIDTELKPIGQMPGEEPVDPERVAGYDPTAWPRPGEPVEDIAPEDAFAPRLREIEQKKQTINERYGQFSKWIDQQVPDAAEAHAAKGRLAGGWQAQLKVLDKQAEAIRKGQEVAKKEVQARAESVKDIVRDAHPPGEIVRRTAPAEDGTVYGRVRQMVLDEQDRIMAEAEDARKMAKKDAIYMATHGNTTTPWQRQKAQQKYRQTINKINAQERDSLSRLHGAYADDLRQAMVADQTRIKDRERETARVESQQRTGALRLEYQTRQHQHEKDMFDQRATLERDTKNAANQLRRDLAKDAAALKRDISAAGRAERRAAMMQRPKDAVGRLALRLIAERDQAIARDDAQDKARAVARAKWQADPLNAGQEMPEEFAPLPERNPLSQSEARAIAEEALPHPDDLMQEMGIQDEATPQDGFPPAPSSEPEGAVVAQPVEKVTAQQWRQLREAAQCANPETAAAAQAKLRELETGNANR